jgi:hypothetical protein
MLVFVSSVGRLRRMPVCVKRTRVHTAGRVGHNLQLWALGHSPFSEETYYSHPSRRQTLANHGCFSRGSPAGR